MPSTVIECIRNSSAVLKLLSYAYAMRSATYSRKLEEGRLMAKAVKLASFQIDLIYVSSVNKLALAGSSMQRLPFELSLRVLWATVANEGFLRWYSWMSAENRKWLLEFGDKDVNDHIDSMDKAAQLPASMPHLGQICAEIIRSGKWIWPEETRSSLYGQIVRLDHCFTHGNLLNIDVEKHDDPELYRGIMQSCSRTVSVFARAISILCKWERDWAQLTSFWTMRPSIDDPKKEQEWRQAVQKITGIKPPEWLGFSR